MRAFGWLAPLLVIIALAFPSRALAQGSGPERELEAVRRNFEVGNYKDALQRAKQAMESSNFDEGQRVELQKFAGLSAFNLRDSGEAETHFLALLKLNPDYVLDPFAYPPPVIKLFEDVRKKNVDALNLIRQQLALRDEQARREKAERELKAKEAQERAERLEALSKQVTVRTVEKRSFLLNFLPFGLGQFQESRTIQGALFAGFEGAMAVVSIVGFLAINGLYKPIVYSYDDRIYPITFRVDGIPPDRQSEYQVWNVVKFGSAILFYIAWAIGVGDALWHHQDETITTEKKNIDELERDDPANPGAPAKPPPPRASLLPVPTDAHPYLFGTPGGGGAGVELRF